MVLIFFVLNSFQEVYFDQFLEWNKVIKDLLFLEVILFRVILILKEGLLGIIFILFKFLISYYIFERMLIVIVVQFYFNVVKQFVVFRIIIFYFKEFLFFYEIFLLFFVLGLWLGVLEGFVYLQYQLFVLWGSNDCIRFDYFY